MPPKPSAGDRPSYPSKEEQATSFWLGFSYRLEMGPLVAPVRESQSKAMSNAELLAAKALASRDGMTKDESDGVNAMREGSKVDKGPDQRAWYVGYNAAESGYTLAQGVNFRKIIEGSLGTFLQQCGMTAEVGAEAFEAGVKDLTGVNLDGDDATFDDDDGYLDSLADAYNAL